MGTTKPNAVKRCPRCNGKGFIMQTTMMMGIMAQTQSVCPECGGEGSSISSKDKCKTCHGKKVKRVREDMSVTIKPGMDHGQKVVLRGAADQDPHMETGDIVFYIDQIPHSVFRRRGSDLFVRSQISLLDSLTHASLQLRHLSGKTVRLETLEGDLLPPGAVRCVEGLGMPMYGQEGQFGRLFVQMSVQYPKELSPKQQELLKMALGAPGAVAKGAEEKKPAAEEKKPEEKEEKKPAAEEKKAEEKEEKKAEEKEEKKAEEKEEKKAEEKEEKKPEETKEEKKETKEEAKETVYTMKPCDQSIYANRKLWDVTDSSGHSLVGSLPIGVLILSLSCLLTNTSIKRQRSNYRHRLFSSEKVQNALSSTRKTLLLSHSSSANHPSSANPQSEECVSVPRVPPPSSPPPSASILPSTRFLAQTLKLLLVPEEVLQQRRHHHILPQLRQRREVLLSLCTSFRFTSPTKLASQHRVINRALEVRMLANLFFTPSPSTHRLDRQSPRRVQLQHSTQHAQTLVAHKLGRNLLPQTLLQRGQRLQSHRGNELNMAKCLNHMRSVEVQARSRSWGSRRGTRRCSDTSGSRWGSANQRGKQTEQKD